MSVFRFKHFSIQQAESAMKVGTDAMILGALIQAENCKNALDIGSGTGVLSLMIAQGNSDLKIDAVEIDDRAALECERNFQNSNWSDRLNVIHGDFLSYKTSMRYDLIFSNPPFYQSSLVNQDERKGRARHEQSMSIPAFLENVNNLLAEKGFFWLIVPFDDVDSWQNIAEKNRLYLNEMISVYGKRNDNPKRAILKFGGKLMKPLKSSLVIRELNGRYSAEYIELTKEFHGKAV